MEFFWVICKTGAETTEGIGRANNDRVTDFPGGIKRSVDRLDGNRFCDRDVDFLN